MVTISDHDNYLFFIFIPTNAAARIAKCIASCSPGDFYHERSTLGVRKHKHRCFFLPNKLSVGDRVSERKCIRLKVLWMIISGHCAPSKQQRLDPAVQHFDTTLSALELATDLCKKIFVESL